MFGEQYPLAAQRNLTARAGVEATLHVGERRALQCLLNVKLAAPNWPLANIRWTCVVRDISIMFL